MLVSDVILDSLEKYPLKMREHLQEQLGVLKQTSSTTAVTQTLLSEINIRLAEALLWKILEIKYQTLKITPSVSQELTLQINDCYMFLLTQLKPPRDKTLNIIIFYNTYVCHMVYFFMFSMEKNMTELRFLFDCYHISLYSINGTKVSDVFIQLMIEKVFNSRFLDYQNKALDDLKIKIQMNREQNSYLGDEFVNRKDTQLSGHERPVIPLIRINRAISDKGLRKRPIDTESVSPGFQMQQQVKRNFLTARKREINIQNLQNLLDTHKKQKAIDPVQREQPIRSNNKQFDLYNIQPRQNSEDSELSRRFLREMMDMSYILAKKKESMSDLYFARGMRKKIAKDSESQGSSLPQISQRRYTPEIKPVTESNPDQNHQFEFTFNNQPPPNETKKEFRVINQDITKNKFRINPKNQVLKFNDNGNPQYKSRKLDYVRRHGKYQEMKQILSKSIENRNDNYFV